MSETWVSERADAAAEGAHPTKVVRCEVENAVSVAAMILLAETVVPESVQGADRPLPAAPLS